MNLPHPDGQIFITADKNRVSPSQTHPHMHFVYVFYGFILPEEASWCDIRSVRHHPLQVSR